MTDFFICSIEIATDLTLKKCVSTLTFKRSENFIRIKVKKTTTNALSLNNK